MKTLKQFPLVTFPKLILLLCIFGLAITGTECENILNPFGDGEIDGTWELVGMQGDLQDVCLGEVATFNTATNNATLRCPNQSTITRPFSFNGTTLTYTNSGVSYNVGFNTLSNGVEQLILTGNNVNRTLTYNKISN